eukprot:TRINITY_DN14428_c3_g1_i1.p1 TRINITY_DN14428_c3_g1~~TRINITY_DN14428_c3_g1_i1.p1  ORF type:complete len:525 (-),score=83.20 TRINITY_DN14428_c3_g1_i1:182-1756(-)
MLTTSCPKRGARRNTGSQIEQDRIGPVIDDDGSPLAKSALCDLGFGPLSCQVTLARPAFKCLQVCDEASPSPASPSVNPQEAGSEEAPPDGSFDDDFTVAPAFFSPRSSRSWTSDRELRDAGANAATARHERLGDSAFSGNVGAGDKVGACAEQPTQVNERWVAKIRSRTSVGEANLQPSVKRRDFTDAALLRFEVKLIGDAVGSGRYVDAHRRLEALEASHVPVADYFGKATLERIHRIGSRYLASLKELERGDEGGWQVDEDQANGFIFASRLAEDKFQVLSSIEIHGVDATTILTGLCEYENHKKFDPKLTEARPIDSETLNDTLWQVLKDEVHGKREDNILHVSFVDALDEDLGGFWLSSYTPSDPSGESVAQLTELNGKPMPKASAGAVRLSSWRNTFVVTPIRNKSADFPGLNRPTVRITFALCRLPSSAAYVFPAVMRKEVGDILKRFRSFILKHGALNWQALVSSQATFYDSARRHLLEKMPAALTTSTPLHRLTFAELSQHLPRNWADYHEPVYI